MAALSTKTQHLIIVEAAAYGSVLNVLNEFGRRGADFQIIECLHRGEKSTLIVMGSEDSLSALIGISQIDVRVIENPHAQLLPVYLNLINVPLREVLYVFEADGLATLLAVSNDFLNEGLEVFDIRSLRGQAGKGIVMATGDTLKAGAAEKARVLGKLTEIHKPNPALRELFEMHC